MLTEVGGLLSYIWCLKWVYVEIDRLLRWLYEEEEKVAEKWGTYRRIARYASMELRQWMQWDLSNNLGPTRTGKQLKRDASMPVTCSLAMNASVGRRHVVVAIRHTCRPTKQALHWLLELYLAYYDRMPHVPHWGSLLLQTMTGSGARAACPRKSSSSNVIQKIKITCM